MNNKELCNIAISAMEKSYSPYSNYHVGAALLCKNGKVFTGCNIENAAYGPTVCAERTAFFKAISEGEREFISIAVAGGKDGKISGVFPPCGVCRQVMAEFCDENFTVIVVSDNDRFKEYKLNNLLPEAFGPKYI